MPTFLGATSTPADNGTNATTAVSITPVASMVSGDLVVVYTLQRGTGTWSNTTTGGQTWSLYSDHLVTFSAAIFYCVYNGTWATNPIFTCTAGTNTTVVMLVFRPDVSTNTWNPGGSVSFSNIAAAATTTINSINTVFPNTVAIASWMTQDDNTWGTLTGTNWSKTNLSAQYRNTAGNDTSLTFAYNILASPGATNNVSQTQLTLGNDETKISLYTFYEITPVAAGFDPMGTMGFFGI